MHGIIKRSKTRELGFSLIEVIVAISIATAVAVAIVPYLVQPADTTKRHTCDIHQARLNLEVSLWRHAHNRWPEYLSEVTSDEMRFPDGAPVCPVNQEPYQLDTSGTKVVPHSHE